jgi:hypothetical protein
MSWNDCRPLDKNWRQRIGIRYDENMAVINEEVELLMLSAGDYELVKQKLGTNYTECNQWLRHDTRASHKVETSRYSGLVDSVPS